MKSEKLYWLFIQITKWLLILLAFWTGTAILGIFIPKLFKLSVWCGLATICFMVASALLANKFKPKEK